MSLSEKFARKMKEWEYAVERRTAHVDALILHRDIFNIALMDYALGRTPEYIARRQENSTAPAAEAEKIQTMMEQERSRIAIRTVNDRKFRDEFNRYAAAARVLEPVMTAPPDAGILDKAVLVARRIALTPQRVTFMAAEQNLYDSLHKNDPYKIAP